MSQQGRGTNSEKDDAMTSSSTPFTTSDDDVDDDESTTSSTASSEEEEVIYTRTPLSLTPAHRYELKAWKALRRAGALGATLCVDPDSPTMFAVLIPFVDCVDALLGSAGIDALLLIVQGENFQPLLMCREIGTGETLRSMHIDLSTLRRGRRVANDNNTDDDYDDGNNSSSCGDDSLPSHRRHHVDPSSSPSAATEEQKGAESHKGSNNVKKKKIPAPTKDVHEGSTSTTTDEDTSSSSGQEDNEVAEVAQVRFDGRAALAYAVGPRLIVVDAVEWDLCLAEIPIKDRARSVVALAPSSSSNYSTVVVELDEPDVQIISLEQRAVVSTISCLDVETVCALNDGNFLLIATFDYDAPDEPHQRAIYNPKGELLHQSDFEATRCNGQSLCLSNQRSDSAAPTDVVLVPEYDVIRLLSVQRQHNNIRRSNMTAGTDKPTAYLAANFDKMGIPGHWGQPYINQVVQLPLSALPPPNQPDEGGEQHNHQPRNQASTSSRKMEEVILPASLFAVITDGSFLTFVRTPSIITAPAVEEDSSSRVSDAGEEEEGNDDAATKKAEAEANTESHKLEFLSKETIFRRDDESDTYGVAIVCYRDEVAC